MKRISQIRGKRKAINAASTDYKTFNIIAEQMHSKNKISLENYVVKVNKKCKTKRVSAKL